MLHEGRVNTAEAPPTNLEMGGGTVEVTKCIFPDTRVDGVVTLLDLHVQPGLLGTGDMESTIAV